MILKPAPAMPSDSEKSFWRLLGDYEALTQQESLAIRHEDFPSLINAQRLKTAIFPDWLQMGTELGISREVSAELHERLEGITAQENDNMLALAAIRDAARQRIGELAQARQRLTHIRRNYHEKEIPSAIPTGFVAHG